VHAATLAADRSLGPRHRLLQGLGARGQGDIVERRRERGPVGLARLARAEPVERVVREGAKAVGIEIIQRDADDPAARDEPGAGKVEQARQQLAAGEVAGGAEQDDNLRLSRADPRGVPCQLQFPVLFASRMQAPAGTRHLWYGRPQAQRKSRAVAGWT
jgi:hypothetical protein